MNRYRRTSTTVSLVNYHIVFCPKFRRRLFDIPGFENRFKDSVFEICKRNGFIILAMECHHDHVHLFLNALPKYSPADIVRIIKTNTSKAMREYYPNLIRSCLWTRSYFVSTAGDVSPEIITKYIETQKTRP